MISRRSYVAYLLSVRKKIEDLSDVKTPPSVTSYKSSTIYIIEMLNVANNIRRDILSKDALDYFEDEALKNSAYNKYLVFSERSGRRDERPVCYT